MAATPSRESQSLNDAAGRVGFWKRPLSVLAVVAVAAGLSIAGSSYYSNREQAGQMSLSDALKAIGHSTDAEAVHDGLYVAADTGLVVIQALIEAAKRDDATGADARQYLKNLALLTERYR